MPAQIVFPPVEPECEFSRDCLSFPALVDGQQVKCLVTFELLIDRFGARASDWSEQEMKRAFQENKASILALAESQIRLGRISAKNEVVLTTLTTSLRAVYYDRLRESPEALHLARQATRWLEEVLGPFGGEVSAAWDRGEDARGRPVITLQLSDFAGSVTAVFDPKELQSPAQARVRLNRLWSDLLQIRAHQQLQGLMTSGRAVQ